MYLVIIRDEIVGVVISLDINDVKLKLVNLAFNVFICTVFFFCHTNAMSFQTDFM